MPIRARWILGRGHTAAALPALPALVPNLRLTSAVLRHGRLVIRGRLTRNAHGRLALKVRLPHGRVLARNAIVAGGRFTITLRARKARTVGASFAGDSAFRPARASVPVRR
jgi:hypothetical protein